MLMFMSCVGKKVALLVALKDWLCVFGVKPNVPLMRLAKIVFKKCGSTKKIKNIVSA